MTELRSDILRAMFGSIPQGAGDLFSSDDELVEFCVGMLTDHEKALALKDVELLVTQSDEEQLIFWRSFDAEVVIRSTKYAVLFSRLLLNRLKH